MSSYSLIIRTLAGGGKYRTLLESIDAQTIKPQHVYVVIPHGYKPPEETLGYEEIVYTQKGMWQQRMYGMEYAAAQPCASEYQLVCDDDVSFSPDFAERLMKIAAQYGADGVIPMRDKHIPLSQGLIPRLGAMRFESNSSRFKISIMRSAGFKVNNNLPGNVNPTQSGPFQCFLFRSDSVAKVNMSEELWLDATPYALPDDQVFFYKSYLSGLKVYACKSPLFKHLDGGSSNPMRAVNSAYSSGRNFYIFWRKFIYGRAESALERMRCRVALARRVSVQLALYWLIGVKSRDTKCLRAYRKGLHEGKKYFNDN